MGKLRQGQLALAYKVSIAVLPNSGSSAWLWQIVLGYIQQWHSSAVQQQHSFVVKQKHSSGVKRWHSFGSGVKGVVMQSIWQGLAEEVQGSKQPPLNRASGLVRPLAQHFVCPSMAQHSTLCALAWHSIALRVTQHGIAQHYVRPR